MKNPLHISRVLAFFNAGRALGILVLLGASFPATAQSDCLNFAPFVTYGSGGESAYSVATADFNGDGKADVVTANNSSDNVGVLLGRGDGSFASAIAYSSGGSFPYTVATGDFNGDGKADVVTVNGISGNISVLLNQGDGSFAPVVTYDSGGRGSFGVATADFNGDGKVDVVTANNVSDNVGVLISQGDGSFAPAVTYSSGGGRSRAVATADFNGDGKADVAVTNRFSDNVGVLLNQGGGSFAPVVTYDSGGRTLNAIATADFNGDGKADVVTANLFSNTVGVLLNTSTCVPNGCTDATSFSTTAISASSAQLNWVATANPPQWQLRYKTTKPGSKWLTLTVAGSGRSTQLSGLVAGQNYMWQIKALCGKTKTDFSGSVSFQTLPNPTARFASDQTEQSSAGLRVYPNPTRGAFVVELPIEAANGEARLELMNMMGQTLQVQELRLSEGTLQESIQVVSWLAPGLYMVKVKVGEQTYYTRLLYAR